MLKGISETIQNEKERRKMKTFCYVTRYVRFSLIKKYFNKTKKIGQEKDLLEQVKDL